MTDHWLAMTTIISFATFVMGFLLCIIALNSRFVPRASCVESRTTCERVRRELAQSVVQDVMKRELNIEQLKRQLTTQHLIIMAVATKMEIDVEALTRNFP